jgi:hypothetical protein
MSFFNFRRNLYFCMKIIVNWCRCTTRSHLVRSLVGKEQGQAYLLPWLETTLHVFRLLQDTVLLCFPVEVITWTPPPPHLRLLQVSRGDVRRANWPQAIMCELTPRGQSVSAGSLAALPVCFLLSFFPVRRFNGAYRYDLHFLTSCFLA